MMFTVEIVPKGRDYAVAETVVHDGREPGAWTEEDVVVVLTEILRAIDRAANPGADDRAVTLRGFSWIVEPSGDEVVIAIEIPSGAAVAGPFAIEHERLSGMIARVLATPDRPGPGGSRVH